MIATTIEQSKALLEAGLNPDSADMVLTEIPIFDTKTKTCKFSGEYQLSVKRKGQRLYDTQFSAWSLGALLDIASKGYYYVPVANSKELIDELVKQIIEKNKS